ncbi:MAG TPA: hypothetical protein VHT25_04710 [Solirubrobacteraceae bacterium]|nr:hypothetical protein [Solirubrobacteraceae bacterium]
MRRALTVYAAFGIYISFTASPVRDSRGQLWRRPFYRTWQEVDWDAPCRSRLSEPEREVLACLLDAAEPTWIVASALTGSSDRAAVEEILRGLEEQGLLSSVIEEGGEPGGEGELDHWWAVTDGGWDVLGLIKPPTYR